MTGDSEALVLLERCQRGDLDALGDLYDLFGNRVYRLSLSILGQPADAEDAVQEVFLRVFDKAESFAGRSSVGTWLYRLTTNACLNLRRRQKKQPLSLVTDEPPAPALDRGPTEAARPGAERELPG